MVAWQDGRVSIGDSVAGTPPLTGEQLADAYWAAMRDVTFGLARRRGGSVAIGPVELLRLGEPAVGAHGVEWPIEGGLLAGAPGGRWVVTSQDGRVDASMEGFRPRLPRPLYAISHQQLHLLATRLFLLRLPRAGRAGVPAPAAGRRQAAAVDIAFCLTVTRLAGFRLRPKTALAVAAGYHIACWSISGRTLGGLVTGQRVVAVDGSRLTPTQSAFRLALLPLAWVLRRPIHDEMASTEVIKG